MAGIECKTIEACEWQYFPPKYHTHTCCQAPALSQTQYLDEALTGKIF
jgi:hypothetical protein